MSDRDLKEEPFSASLPPSDLFSYFSTIEERFSARRGSVLLLSTLDWALIEIWREAGVPLAAALRGIDGAFDRYEQRAVRALAGRSRLRKVNGLAWCAQAVMEAAEEMVDAATGVAISPPRSNVSAEGFEAERVAAFLTRNASALHAAAAEQPPGQTTTSTVLIATARRLEELAGETSNAPAIDLEALDRTLTVLEERLLASLIATVPEPELVNLRAEADHALAGVKARLGAAQGRQVREQFVHKRLLELYALPRLSLFYLGVG